MRNINLDIKFAVEKECQRPARVSLMGKGVCIKKPFDGEFWTIEFPLDIIAGTIRRNTRQHLYQILYCG